jgi:hypothetical protein
MQIVFLSVKKTILRLFDLFNGRNVLAVDALTLRSFEEKKSGPAAGPAFCM